MSINTKTPVMVLQELTVKCGLPPPEYNIIHSKTGTHENEFCYEVVVAGVCAIASGRSKQIAKHLSARKALDLLADKGLYKPHQNPVQDFNPGVRNVEGSPVKISYNSVGMLSDFCAENKIPMPVFVEISDVGPPHCREFTYECRLASYTTRATAGTKKQAKHIAASDMFDKIKDITDRKDPEIFGVAITENDNVAMEKFIKLSILNKVIPNLSVKLEDYGKTIPNIMKEKEITIESIKPYLEDRMENSLKELLALLDLEYEILPIIEGKTILVLNISTDTPFSVMQQGTTMEDCKKKLIHLTFEILNTLLLD